MREWAIVLLVALCICVTVCATIDRIVTVRRVTDELTAEVRAMVQVLRIHEITEQDAVRRLREDLNAIKAEEEGLLRDMAEFREYLNDLECRLLEALDGQGIKHAGEPERPVGPAAQD